MQHAQVGDNGAAGQVALAAAGIELPEHLMGRIARDPKAPTVDLDAPALGIVGRWRAPSVVEQAIAQLGGQRGRLALQRSTSGRDGASVAPSGARARQVIGTSCLGSYWARPNWVSESV